MLECAPTPQGTQFISHLHFYSCLENNRWNILLSVWKGRKTAGKGGRGEAFIPSALPRVWLTMQPSLFSDVQVWKGLETCLRRTQSRCQGGSICIHTHQGPCHWKGLLGTLHHVGHLMPNALWSASQCPISEVIRGRFPKVWGQHFFSFFPLSTKSLMLIKAECLISSRWPVSLNYLFVFLFTVSVCLQFFVSLWKSVIRAHVSFWLQSLPDEPPRWYVDDLLIYGF